MKRRRVGGGRGASVKDFSRARTQMTALKSLPAQVIAISLTSRQRVALFCAAAGIPHNAVGIVDHVMQVLIIRGLLEQRGGRYVLTEQGRDVFDAVLRHGKE